MLSSIVLFSVSKKKDSLIWLILSNFLFVTPFTLVIETALDLAFTPVEIALALAYLLRKFWIVRIMPIKCSTVLFGLFT